MESFINSLQSFNPLWIYIALFSIAYIENIFPPSPSDVIIVCGGSLVGIGRIDFFPALLITTLGATAGFMTMYKIGDWFGISIVERHKIRFLPLENIHKIESWFRKYGYWIIIANRFLSGTRAIVSFFAGMSELNLTWTTILCFCSALLWNALLLCFGRLLGQNWRSIGLYLSTYSQFATGTIIAVAVTWICWRIYKRNRISE